MPSVRRYWKVPYRGLLRRRGTYGISTIHQSHENHAMKCSRSAGGIFLCCQPFTVARWYTECRQCCYILLRIHRKLMAPEWYAEG